MAKKSQVRIDYEKQLKRIDRALLNIRREGYDVSALTSLPSKNPKRVTQKMLREAKAITPKKLRAELNNLGGRTGYIPYKGTPLRSKTGSLLSTSEIFDWEETQEQRPTSQFALRKLKQLREQRESENLYHELLNRHNEARQRIQEIEEQTQEPTYEELYEEPLEETLPDYYTDDTTETLEYITPEEPEEHIQETYTVIEGNEVLYVDLETGEIIDRSPLAIEELGDYKIAYIDATTGEVIKEEIDPNYLTPNVNDIAYERLKEYVNRLPRKVASVFTDMILRMIEIGGQDLVVVTFNNTINSRGNFIDNIAYLMMLYEEVVNFIGEMIEKLPFTESEKDQLRVELAQQTDEWFTEE